MLTAVTVCLTFADLTPSDGLGPMRTMLQLMDPFMTGVNLAAPAVRLCSQERRQDFSFDLIAQRGHRPQNPYHGMQASRTCMCMMFEQAVPPKDATVMRLRSIRCTANVR